MDYLDCISWLVSVEGELWPGVGALEDYSGRLVQYIGLERLVYRDGLVPSGYDEKALAERGEVAGIVRQYGKYEHLTEVVWDLGERCVELRGKFESKAGIRLVFATRGCLSLKDVSFEGFSTVAACVGEYNVVQGHCHYERNEARLLLHDVASYILAGYGESIDVLGQVKGEALCELWSSKHTGFEVGSEVSSEKIVVLSNRGRINIEGQLKSHEVKLAGFRHGWVSSSGGMQARQASIDGVDLQSEGHLISTESMMMVLHLFHNYGLLHYNRGEFSLDLFWSSGRTEGKESTNLEVREELYLDRYASLFLEGASRLRTNLLRTHGGKIAISGWDVFLDIAKLELLHAGTIREEEVPCRKRTCYG